MVSFPLPQLLLLMGLARYAKLRVAHAPAMSGTFSPSPRVSDSDMHHGTCVTRVPWCMIGSLASGFLWSRWPGKLSGIHGACVSGKWPMYVVAFINIFQEYVLDRVMWRDITAMRILGRQYHERNQRSKVDVEQALRQKRLGSCHSERRGASTYPFSQRHTITESAAPQIVADNKCPIGKFTKTTERSLGGDKAERTGDDSGPRNNLFEKNGFAVARVTRSQTYAGKANRWPTAPFQEVCSRQGHVEPNTSRGEIQRATTGNRVHRPTIQITSTPDIEKEVGTQGQHLVIPTITLTSHTPEVPRSGVQSQVISAVPTPVPSPAPSRQSTSRRSSASGLGAGSSRSPSRKGSFIDTIATTQQLRRELRRLQRNRNSSKSVRYTREDHLRLEKLRFLQCQGKIDTFYKQLHEDKLNRNYSRWTLMELEQELKI